MISKRIQLSVSVWVEKAVKKAQFTVISLSVSKNVDNACKANFGRHTAKAIDEHFRS